MERVKSDAKKSLIARFAIFAETAMSELAKANKDLEQANRVLEIMSVTDGLTQLLNRVKIERLIREAYENDASKPALVMVDLDDFKHVNDTLGHNVGDAVLKTFARTLTQAASEGDFDIRVGRWGGEEFMLLVRGAGLDEAKSVAETVRELYANASIAGLDAHTASFGVIAMHEGESVESALTRADKAMYEAKQQGKNRVVVL